MTKEIKNYLDKIMMLDRKQYFLFYRFYLNPSLSLNGNSKELSKNYYQFGDIKYFFFNNLFLEFLSICLKDDFFIQKLDEITLKIIRYILFDAKEIYEDFSKDNSVNGNKFRNNLNNCPEQGIINFKYKKLVNVLKTDINCIKDLNIKLIEDLIKTITLREEWYCEQYVLPKLVQEDVLWKIRNDDYSELENCFLFEHRGLDSCSFQALVCNNEFLRLIDEELLNKELDFIIIEHIIGTLEMGIDFKCLKAKYEGFWERYHQLEHERIVKYNYKEAMRLISLLKRKKKERENIREISSIESVRTYQLKRIRTK